MFIKRILRNSFALSRNGWTLVELSVVLAIAGVVLLSFSIPSFLAFNNISRLKSQAEKISSVIRYAYSLAARNNVVLRLNYDLDKGYYWVTQKGNDGVFTDLEDSLLKKRRLLENIKFKDVATFEGKVSSGITYSGFLPNGFIENTVIHLEELDSQKTVSLLVNPLDGETRILEGYVVLDAR